MDLYDSRNFKLNKKLLIYVGLWPFDSRGKKIVLRLVFGSGILGMAMPHLIGFHVHFGVDIDRVLLHATVIVFCTMIFVKLISSVITENKMRIIYKDVASNWQMIIDKNEKEKLIEYAERARFISLFYLLYIVAADITFFALPLMPIILNKIKPLNESRPYLFVLDGEFLVNRNQHYGKIYIYDFITITLTVFVATSVDTIYVSCMEQCCGLFAILKYRLNTPYKMICNLYAGPNKDPTYEWMVSSIRLHKKVLFFKDIVENSYSSSFLFLIGLTILHISLLSVLMLINLNKYFNLIRYGMLWSGMVIHLFYLSWPGQKLVDHSSELFRYAYLNEWYHSSQRSKKLLRILTLRCLEPCKITAGGLYVMNFENFASIMKTSISYVTVFSSFRG